jgi:8-oxo-dGTP diphosphatase
MANAFASRVRHSSRRRRVSRFFLPGGGLEPNERPEDALVREIVEECGWEAQILSFIGAATQFLSAEGEGYFAIRARYYRVRRVRQVATAVVIWMRRDEAIAVLARESDAWAVREEEASFRPSV